MINIRNILPMLYDYYLVATEMSFSAAAEKNFLSQSNLSRSVQNLENTLNLQLINRTNKGITLTKDGEELYNKVDRIFNNLKNYDFSLKMVKYKVLWLLELQEIFLILNY